MEELLITKPISTYKYLEDQILTYKSFIGFIKSKEKYIVIFWEDGFEVICPLESAITEHTNEWYPNDLDDVGDGDPDLINFLEDKATEVYLFESSKELFEWALK